MSLHHCTATFPVTACSDSTSFPFWTRWSPFGPLLGLSLAVSQLRCWNNLAVAGAIQCLSRFVQATVFFKSQVCNFQSVLSLAVPTLSLKPPRFTWLFQQTPDVILQADRHFQDPSNHPCFCSIAGELSGPWAPTQTPATVVIIVTFPKLVLFVVGTTTKN